MKRIKGYNLISDPVDARFDHDCVECHYLGTLLEFWEDGDEVGVSRHDLYYHSHEGLEATVIARHGNDGPDYSSGIGFLSSEHLLLAELEAAAQFGYKPRSRVR